MVKVWSARIRYVRGLTLNVTGQTLDYMTVIRFVMLSLNVTGLMSTEIAHLLNTCSMKLFLKGV